jgi:DNA polymerase
MIKRICIVILTALTIVFIPWIAGHGNIPGVDFFNRLPLMGFFMEYWLCGFVRLGVSTILICLLICSDFAQIEARVIAWYAKEKWRMDLFENGGKIYEASAAKMFHVPIEEVTRESVWRSRGKIAELALGYQGSSGAILRMPGGKELGLSAEAIKQEIVNPWREANDRIVNFWYSLQEMALTVMQERLSVKNFGIVMWVDRNVFYIKLPSGRRLAYLRPKLEDGKFGPQLTYEGVDDKNKWARVPTYGGKLAENITQATARDLLAEKMLALDAAGFQIVGHVHDEVIIECDVAASADAKKQIHEIMKAPISWAVGLPLGADTATGFYYKKDL